MVNESRRCHEIDASRDPFQLLILTRVHACASQNIVGKSWDTGRFDA